MPFLLDGLDTEDYDRNYRDTELLRRISGYFSPHRRQMVLASLMLTLNSAAGTAGPILISRALDLAVVNPSTQVLLLLSLGVLLLGVFAWGFNYIRQVVSAKVVGNVVSDDFGLMMICRHVHEAKVDVRAEAESLLQGMEVD